MDHLDPFSATVEDFSLALLKELVFDMPDIEGAWPNAVSLSRLGRSKMPYKMLKRFVAKIQLHDMGYVPDPSSVWSQFHQPCWLWQGGLHPKGYGRFYLGIDPDTDTKMWVYTHRLAFEHWVAMPKPGYIVDHECEVKTCCNPTHLWPVSNPENIRLADLRRPWKRRNQYSKE